MLEKKIELSVGDFESELSEIYNLYVEEKNEQDFTSVAGSTLMGGGLLTILCC